MLLNKRIRLGVAALVAAAALPLVLRTGAAGEEARLTPIPDSYAAGEDDKRHPEKPCPCRDSGAESKESDAAPFVVVEHLSPRLTEEALRWGVDLALVYAEFPMLEPDLYFVRLYVAEDVHLVTLVDRRGDEIPLDVLGYPTDVNFCKPQDNDIDGCWPDTDPCIVECDPRAGWCVQTCIVAPEDPFDDLD